MVVLTGLCRKRSVYNMLCPKISLQKGIPSYAYLYHGFKLLTLKRTGWLFSRGENSTENDVLADICHSDCANN